MIAEEYAILDNLTRGRLIAGFVRGIGAEYHAMGINPAHSQERYAEAVEAFEKAVQTHRFSENEYVVDTWFWIARCHLRRNESGEARKYL